MLENTKHSLTNLTAQSPDELRVMSMWVLVTSVTFKLIAF
jgi:hypothetical protein